MKRATIDTALVMLAHGFSSDDCPDAKTNHDHLGNNYLASSESMEQMHATHRQKQCPKCGFFAVWVPRKGR